MLCPCTLAHAPSPSAQALAGLNAWGARANRGPPQSWSVGACLRLPSSATMHRQHTARSACLPAPAVLTQFAACAHVMACTCCHPARAPACCASARQRSCCAQRPTAVRPAVVGLRPPRHCSARLTARATHPLFLHAAPACVSSCHACMACCARRTWPACA